MTQAVNQSRLINQGAERRKSFFSLQTSKRASVGSLGRTRRGLVNKSSLRTAEVVFVIPTSVKTIDEGNSDGGG